MADDRGGVTHVFRPEGEAARVEGTSEVMHAETDFVVERLSAEHIVGLPPPQPEVIYIVNSQVARATDRDDVVTPEMADASMVQDKYVGIRKFVNVRRSSSASDDA